MTDSSGAAGSSGDDDRLRTWRAQALSFGAVADGYERVRPGYPPATATWALGPAPLRVADVGAGTGKWTRVLRDLGHDVTAVEPDPGMRARLSQVLPDVDVREGSGERLPLPDASVDALTFAQSWHWVDPSAGTAEAVRVLRPGGRLVLVWNRRDPDAPLSRAVAATVADVEPELLERAAADSTDLAAVPRLPGPLVHDGTHEVRNDVVMPVADALALAATWSYLALSGARDDLLAGLGDRLSAVADADGRVVLAQRTYAYRFVVGESEEVLNSPGTRAGAQA
ncbi:class I SAM-dependent methyltransferase [Aquipuribacter sp. SD81]|uniref:class I SAM-dependent methyltransferase n=1 Tax=Aquipuribacter sp. SD81 TaxID=3127703 RepID=UPI0030197AE0